MHAASSQRETSDASNPVLNWLVVAAITALAAAIRLWGLASQGITLDESYTIYLGHIPSAEFSRTIWNSELNMTLYYSLFRLWMHVGQSEWTLRLLGVIFSTVTVPVVYLLGRRLFDRPTGLAAALLLGIHPFHLMLSQRARSYPLAILLVCLASLSFVAGLQKPRWTTWTVYVVLSAAAVYSHFFAVLVILAQLASLLALRQDSIPWKHLLAALALLTVLLLPFLAFMVLHGSATHVSWVQALNAQQLLWLLYSLTLSKGRSLLYLVLWAFAMWTAFRTTSSDARWPFVFTFSWLLVPVGITIVASLHQPLVVERFLSICIPASVLLAGAALVRIATASKSLAIGLAALLVLYSVSGIRFYERHPEFAEGWRESSRYILSRVQPTDAVIADGMTGLTFDYYRDRHPGAPSAVIRLGSFEEELPTPAPQNVWILALVRFNPNWRGAVPRSAEDAVQRFAVRHRNEYCHIAPDFEVGETRVWHFERCSEAK